MPPEIKRGQRWLNVKTGQTVRVMSSEPIEGYVVARYKGAMPWLLHVNEWRVKFTLIENGAKEANRG